jgi:hypothetical protein
MRRSDKPCCENKILYKAIAIRVLIQLFLQAIIYEQMLEQAIVYIHGAFSRC